MHDDVVRLQVKLADGVSAAGANRAEHLLRRVRERCLALPETRETRSFGHPNFLAGAKTFVAFERIAGRPSIAFRQPPGELDSWCSTPGFFATPYGRGVWVSLWADRRIAWPTIARLVEGAYREVALKRMIAALHSNARRRTPRART